jgi:hypothetical protein
VVHAHLVKPGVDTAADDRVLTETALFSSNDASAGELPVSFSDIKGITPRIVSKRFMGKAMKIG